MQVTVRRENGVGILDVDGYINSEGGEQVAQTCQRLLGEDVRSFLINLEKCSIVNSVGISFLIEVIETVREMEGRTVFCSVSATIAKTFRIMGLLQSAAIFETESAALEELT